MAGRLAARAILIALFVVTVVYFDGWRGLLVLAALSVIPVIYVKYVRKQGSAQP
ncbi:hypothetical protein [Bosea sp. LjRoot237]|uniref:hypothetical protein n=1 Tax=Bosea sp. LjRoot237 TaxID=3342292 RepID=UPI003ECFF56F